MSSTTASASVGTGSEPLAADASEPNALTRVARFAALGVQLGLLAVVLRQFQIHNSAFLRLGILAFAGFAVHYFLPPRFRLPFFAVLSIAGTGMILGGATTAWLVGFGAVVIACCHLPFSANVRIGILMLLGLGLAALRGSGWEFPWSAALWPVLGSMFMFRTLCYFYDSSHGNAPTSFWRAVAYFFMLPNVVFPLFPVVDYQRFAQDYDSGDRHEIYQTGIHWMVRGVTHLLLYRLVYYYYSIGPEDVVNGATLAQFTVANFLLYLRISGQFHLVVGMLHLFGFKLSETNHLYGLSSSFNEFWRRINIYWKDFMMKLFYYPIYFRLRKLGPTKAIVISTLIVFVITWFLHSYQWFWLRGTFPLVWQDGVYWSVFGFIIVANSLYEMSRKKKRASSGITGIVAEGARVTATLAVVVILWSLWTCDSLSAWLSLWPNALRWDGSSAWIALALLAGAVLLFGLMASKEGARAGAVLEGWRPAVVTWAVLPALALVGLPQVHTQFSPGAATFVSSLRSGQLNPRDAARLERSYYDDLLDVGRFNDQLSDLYTERPIPWLDVTGTGLKRFTGDFLEYDLMPSFTAETSASAITTNRWGMRDRDYEKTPPDGTFRVALLGASLVMGWGVEDDETFESILESRLNAELAGGARERYEILNFSAPGYFPLQQAPVLEKALPFEPDMVLYVATARELSRSAAYLVRVVEQDVEIPYAPLRDIVDEAERESEATGMSFAATLRKREEAILTWLYRYVGDSSRERGATPVWLFLPQPEEGISSAETASVAKLARESGFEIVDFSEIYAGRRVEDIRLSATDLHPNRVAHELIATELFNVFGGWPTVTGRPQEP